MFPIVAIARTISLLVFVAPNPDVSANQLKITCDTLFETHHRLRIRVDEVDDSNSNIVFFQAGPGIRIHGTVLRDGTPSDFVASIEIPKSLMPAGGLARGALVTLDVQITSVNQTFDHTRLIGLATEPPSAIRPPPPPTDSEPGDENARGPESSTVEQAPNQDDVDASAESQGDADSTAAANTEDASPNDRTEDGTVPETGKKNEKPQKIEDALRKWEKDVVARLKNDRPAPPPPDIADQQFRCTLRLPAGAGLMPTIACSVYSARSLSQKDVLTRSELSKLESMQVELEKRLFESKHSVYVRQDDSHQKRIRELREEGREILAEAVHSVILSNPNALAGARGRKAIKCVLAVSAVEVEERGRLPLLIINAEIIE